MKRWEEVNRQKTFQKKVVNAKATIGAKSSIKNSIDLKSPPTNMKSPVVNPAQSPNRVNTSSSTKHTNSKISDYTEYERQDPAQIPLYKLLKHYSLQQYAKDLIIRDYGYDLTRLARMSRLEVETLTDQIKMLPGHRVKFMKLVSQINQICFEIMNHDDFISMKQNFQQSPSSVKKPNTTQTQAGSRGRSRVLYEPKPKFDI